MLIVCAVNILTIATVRWTAGADTEQMVTAALAMARGPQGGMSDAQRETAASMMRPMMRFYPVTTLLGALVYLMVFVAMLGSYGKARVSENTIAVVVTVCFVIWLAIRMGWAAVFGG